jgi:hypothetical protein
VKIIFFGSSGFCVGVIPPLKGKREVRGSYEILAERSDVEATATGVEAQSDRGGEDFLGTPAK